MDRMDIANGRDQFGEICRRASAQRERTTITDDGTPVAVVISPAELADLEDIAALAYNRLCPEGTQDFDEFIRAPRLTDAPHTQGSVSLDEMRRLLSDQYTSEGGAT